MYRVKAIQSLLLGVGFANAISFFIYSIKGDEKWFSRLCLIIVCSGFYAIIKMLSVIMDSINKNKEN